MTASPQHRSKRWQVFRLEVLARDEWTCQVKGCGAILCEGRTSPTSAVVDHKQPADLRPDLFYDETNVWAVCREHHAIFDGIEKRLRPDAEAIARAKAEYRDRSVGLDGYPRCHAP